MLNIVIRHISVSLSINLTCAKDFQNTKTAKTKNCKEFGLTVLVKHVFSDNPTKDTWDKSLQSSKVGLL